MTASEQVVTFLRARKPGGYCDDCLASNLRLATRLEAQRTTLALSKMPSFAHDGAVFSMRDSQQIGDPAIGG
jgi:hypothetical protein